MEVRNEFELDLVDLLFYLKKQFLIIVAALLAGAVLGFTASTFFITKQYTASTRVYVLSKSEDASVNYSDLQLSTQILSDFKVLIVGRNVTDTVVEELGLDMTGSQLAKKISVAAQESSRVIQIDVSDPDPQLAARIANKVTEIAAEQTKQFMNLEAVNVVYDAQVPTVPTSPSVSRNTLLCGALLAALAAVVLIVIRVLDDTLRTEDDVERHLGLPTLGVIPASAELDPGPARAAKPVKRPAPRPEQSK